MVVGVELCELDEPEAEPEPEPEPLELSEFEVEDEVEVEAAELLAGVAERDMVEARLELLAEVLMWLELGVLVTSALVLAGVVEAAELAVDEGAAVEEPLPVAPSTVKLGEKL